MITLASHFPTWTSNYLCIVDDNYFLSLLKRRKLQFLDFIEMMEDF